MHLSNVPLGDQLIAYLSGLNLAPILERRWLCFVSGDGAFAGQVGGKPKQRTGRKLHLLVFKWASVWLAINQQREIEARHGAIQL